MTLRWAFTILLNTILYVALWRQRPKHLRWLWVGQTVVLIATALEVWAWYCLPAYPYNVLWTVCDLACAWCEICLLIEVCCNVVYGRHARIGAIYALALFAHLQFWLAEYRSWLDFMNGEGRALQDIREIVNLVMFPIALLAVYLHCSAPAHKEHQ